jgi:hypothetical protein
VARPAVDVSVPLVGAPAAWAAGYSGGQVPVGVLDTGVDADHPDLAGAVAEAADFTAAGDRVDRVGHGTHVASVIAGSGAASGGRYRGMAPDVRLYSGKVCDSTLCTESAVLAGMQWAARDKGLRVVNLSLGHPDEPGTDLLETAIDTLTATYGTLFVVAAGNQRTRVWSPASADAALAVGASDEQDTVAGFSGHDGGKPDIVAPGVDITAARSGDSRLPGDAYTTLSGTSTAAPHVTGAAAILAQQHPDWPPARIKAALTGSATPLDGDSADRAGASRLDVANAVASPVFAEPAGLSFDGPGTGTVTYHNTGAAPVTLTLAAPDDTVAVDVSTVTLPAGGEATVRVTARPGTVRRTGLLAATGGEVAVHTTLTVVPPTYTLTMRFTDRAGARTSRVFAAAYGPGGTAAAGVTLRLPAGTYTLDAKVFENGGGVTLLNRPSLVLDRDTTVDLDARQGRPVTVTAPGRQVYGHVAVTVPGGATAVLQDDSFAGVTAAQIGPGRSGLRTDVAATFTGPDTLSSLAWPVAGRFVTGFARTAGPTGLSVTRAAFAGSGTGTMTRLSPGGGYTSTFPLPHRRTEYFTPGPWQSVFTAGDDRMMASGALEATETWNAGLPGPAFPPASPLGNRITDTEANPAWTADATHGGPPPAPVTVTGNRISAGGTTWTVPPGRTGLLPLSAVRFEPRSATVLGFFAQHQVAGTTLTSLDIEVSYDGGTTWRPPFFSRIGERGVVFLRPGPEPVSLRVTAANSAGSTVTQTMLGAYQR